MSESFQLVNGMLVASGRTPHVDFRSPYTPLNYHVNAWTFRLLGPTCSGEDGPGIPLWIGRPCFLVVFPAYPGRGRAGGDGFLLFAAVLMISKPLQAPSWNGFAVSSWHSFTPSNLLAPCGRWPVWGREAGYRRVPRRDRPAVQADLRRLRGIRLRGGPGDGPIAPVHDRIAWFGSSRAGERYRPAPGSRRQPGRPRGFARDNIPSWSSIPRRTGGAARAPPRGGILSIRHRHRVPFLWFAFRAIDADGDAQAAAVAADVCGLLLRDCRKTASQHAPTLLLPAVAACMGGS